MPGIPRQAPTSSLIAGVESTARAAHEHGYHVVVVTDAVADRSEAVHDHSVGHVFPRLGETGTSQEIIDLLAKRSV